MKEIYIIENLKSGKYLTHGSVCWTENIRKARRFTEIHDVRQVARVMDLTSYEPSGHGDCAVRRVRMTGGKIVGVSGRMALYESGDLLEYLVKLPKPLQKLYRNNPIFHNSLNSSAEQGHKYEKALEEALIVALARIELFTKAVAEDFNNGKVILTRENS